MPEIKERFRDVVVIVATSTSDIDTAIESLRQGAYDRVTKPVNLDEVVYSVKRAMEKRSLELKFRNHQQYVEQRIEQQAKEIRETFLRVIVTLWSAIEAKDIYFAGHSRRVTEIAMAIGKKLGLGKDELENLRWGSLLQDIGKIAVDQPILNKSGKLTSEEYEHIMTHTIVGASIVGSVFGTERIAEVIEHHHAHYDGSGLNQKLRGEDIPLLARIVAVADVYDAICSERPHRDAMSRDLALAEIKWAIGKQFDPVVANTFLEMSPADIMPERRKILIADDEDSIRLLVRNVLGNDYTVIEAADGQEAVAVAQNQKPSLILMDSRMPTKDGLQACYEIKNNPTTKGIPLVMLTAIDHQLERRFSAKLGANECIAKPFGSQTLLEIVNHFLANAAGERSETCFLGSS